MPGCVTPWSRAARSSQSRNHCYAADDLVVHLYRDLGARGNEDVHPRSELHHAETIARVHRVAFLEAADDSPREHADNLADDDRLVLVVDDGLRVLVEVARVRPVPRKETAGMILHLRHAPADRHTVHVHRHW